MNTHKTPSRGILAGAISRTSLARRALMVAAAGVMLTTASQAAVIIIKNDPTIFSTSALTGSATSGDMMAGMEVTVTYSDASTSTAIWAATGLGAGGASNANFFSLTEVGDTFTGNWTLENTRPGLAITGFSIYAKPGDTVFDTTSPAPGTPGSANGADFAFTSGPVTDATVTYSDALKLNAAAVPTGDLYLRMNVSFGQSLASGATLTFRQDTDSVDLPGDIIPVDPGPGTAVPEPGSALVGLMVLGLCGARIGRRDRAAQA
jgi:hypothetical protein